jgi:hypothetical protein
MNKEELKIKLLKHRKSLRRIKDNRFRTRVKESKKIYKRNKKVDSW